MQANKTLFIKHILLAQVEARCASQSASKHRSEAIKIIVSKIKILAYPGTIKKKDRNKKHEKTLDTRVKVINKVEIK